MPNATLKLNNNKSDRQSFADESYGSVRSSFQPQSVARISFVIPVMNEEATIEELVEGIFRNVEDIADVEVIFVDDGSTDDSWAVIQALADIFPNSVRGLRFRSNRGKAAALQVGFEAAEGEIIFTMDADLQDDPKEIPRFLEKLDKGYDLVSGWKAVRHDPWHKVLPSRVFNLMLSRFSRVKLHDHNCGFKCYRRDVAKSIRLFGELHRMVPSLAGMHGFKVTEIVVEHHARQFGVSKYGIERFIRGFSDMLTMGFLRVYRERPSHFANACGVGYGSIAATIALAGLVYGLGSVAGVVCVLAAVCLLGMGAACVLAGLLSELMIRQNHTLAAHNSIVVDTNIAEPQLQLADQYRESESTAATQNLRELLAV
jgi:dolichol-phosphate mannosyltransferase